jgi:GT2 family glycosyltransferase
MAYRKSVFDLCGGFDDIFFEYNNEDSEMAIRALSKGFSFVRTPNAVVLHQKATWKIQALLRSAKNASVWPILKKKYPKHYLVFGPPVKFGFLVNPSDYLYLLTAPAFIPLLLIRYWFHGKRDLKIFFMKWPVLLILRRFFIYKEAIRHRVWMI